MKVVQWLRAVVFDDRFFIGLAPAGAVMCAGLAGLLWGEHRSVAIAADVVALICLALTMATLLAQRSQIATLEHLTLAYERMYGPKYRRQGKSVADSLRLLNDAMPTTSEVIAVFRR